MSLKTLLFAGLIASINASNERMDKYFDYLEEYPNSLGPLGSFEKGEIEIVLDKQKVVEIEALTGRKAGLVAEDKYWIWLNDPVRFPSGVYGMYGRMLWRASLDGSPGCAIMAMFPDGRIALNRNFRHATRCWEYELPRGCREEGETSEEAAARELKEETGLITNKLACLGVMHPDTGVSNSVVPVYLAFVEGVEDAQPESSEAIKSVDLFTIEELKQGFLNGFLITDCGCKINLRDPYLAFALLQWEIRTSFSE